MGRRLVFLSAALLTLFPVMAVYAHERFIRHDLKVPVHEQYFARQPGMLLGMQSDMLRIATVTISLNTGCSRACADQHNERSTTWPTFSRTSQ